MSSEVILRRWSLVMVATFVTRPPPSPVTWGRGLVLVTTRSIFELSSFFSSWNTWTSSCTTPTRGPASPYPQYQRSASTPRLAASRVCKCTTSIVDVQCTMFIPHFCMNKFKNTISLLPLSLFLSTSPLPPIRSLS